MGNKSQAEMESKATLVEVDAPPSGSTERTGVWKRRLSAIMTDDNTGKWFRVFVTSLPQARTYKWNLENGKLVAPDGVFEFAAGLLPEDEKSEEGEAGVYARYIGPADEDESEPVEDSTEDAEQE